MRPALLLVSAVLALSAPGVSGLATGLPLTTTSQPSALDHQAHQAQQAQRTQRLCFSSADCPLVAPLCAEGVCTSASTALAGPSAASAASEWPPHHEQQHHQHQQQQHQQPLGAGSAAPSLSSATWKRQLANPGSPSSTRSAPQPTSTLAPKNCTAVSDCTLPQLCTNGVCMDPGAAINTFFTTRNIIIAAVVVFVLLCGGTLIACLCCKACCCFVRTGVKAGTGSAKLVVGGVTGAAGAVVGAASGKSRNHKDRPDRPFRKDTTFTTYSGGGSAPPPRVAEPEPAVRNNNNKSGRERAGSASTATNANANKGPAPLPANYERPRELFDMVVEETVEVIPMQPQPQQIQQQQQQQQQYMHMPPQQPMQMQQPMQPYYPPPPPGQHVPQQYANGMYPHEYAAYPPQQHQQQQPYGAPLPMDPYYQHQQHQQQYDYDMGQNAYAQQTHLSQSQHQLAHPQMPPVQPYQKHASQQQQQQQPQTNAAAQVYSFSSPPAQTTGPVVSDTSRPPISAGFFGFWDKFGWFHQGYTDKHGNIYGGIFDDEGRFHFGEIGDHEPVVVEFDMMARDDLNGSGDDLLTLASDRSGATRRGRGTAGDQYTLGAARESARDLDALVLGTLRTDRADRAISTYAEPQSHSQHPQAPPASQQYEAQGDNNNSGNGSSGAGRASSRKGRQSPPQSLQTQMLLARDNANTPVSSTTPGMVVSPMRNPSINVNNLNNGDAIDSAAFSTPLSPTSKSVKSVKSAISKRIHEEPESLVTPQEAASHGLLFNPKRMNSQSNINSFVTQTGVSMDVLHNPSLLSGSEADAYEPLDDYLGDSNRNRAHTGPNLKTQ